MTDTAAALVIQLQADFKDFKKQMQAATGVFDAEGRKMAAKQAALKKQLSNWTLDFSGIGGLKTALLGATAVGIVGGIGDLILKSLDAAKAVGEVAQQAGVSTDKLQELRYASTQTGGSFQVMDDALVTFNRNFGEFINTGSGKAATTFKQLGLQAAINSGQVRDNAQAFDFIVGKIRTFGSEAQRAGFTARVFGADAGPKMAGFINAGAQAIADLEAKALSLGIVLSSSTIAGATEAREKLSALFSVMEAQGVNAVAQLAPEIADLASRITESLPDLIAWVEHWASFFGLIQANPIDELRYQINQLQSDMDNLDSQRSGKWWTYAYWFPDSVFEATKANNKTKLDALKAQYDDALEEQLGNEFLNGPIASGPPKPPPLHVNDIAGGNAAAELERKRREALTQLGVDAATANAILVAAENNLAVQLLQGQVGYYDAVKKQIADELAAKIATIDAEEKKQLESLEKLKLGAADYAKYKAEIEKSAADKTKAAQLEAAGKSDEAGSGGLLRQAGNDADKQIQTYKDQIANLGLIEGALAAATFYQEQLNAAREKGIELTPAELDGLKKKAQAVGAAAQAEADAQKISERSIQVQDDIRSGLEDIGAAGLKGFGNLKQAAQQFIEQLAEMILKLYVMKPLIESLLGPAGGNGGGSLGGIFGDLFGGGGSSDAGGVMGFFGFADGGVMTPNGPRNLRKFANGGTSRTPAIFGDAGPEAAVPLPDGRRIPVDLRAPRIPSISGGGAPKVTMAFSIDARGAQIGVAEQIDAKLRAIAPTLVQASVKASRAEFPDNLNKTLRDKH